MTKASAHLADSHPLEGCDEAELYKTLSEERVRLDACRRDYEDGVVKTVIQLAFALIVLEAGFTAQPNIAFLPIEAILVIASLISAGIAIVMGLLEYHYAGKAHADQLARLTAYFSKISLDQGPSPLNAKVKWLQRAALVAFFLSVGAVLLFGTFRAKENLNGTAVTTSPASSGTTSSPASPAASSGTTSSSGTPK